MFVLELKNYLQMKRGIQRIVGDLIQIPEALSAPFSTDTCNTELITSKFSVETNHYLINNILKGKNYLSTHKSKTHAITEH